MCIGIKLLVLIGADLIYVTFNSPARWKKNYSCPLVCIRTPGIKSEKTHIFGSYFCHNIILVDYNVHRPIVNKSFSVERTAHIHIQLIHFKFWWHRIQHQSLYKVHVVCTNISYETIRYNFHCINISSIQNNINTVVVDIIVATWKVYLFKTVNNWK